MTIIDVFRQLATHQNNIEYISSEQSHTDQNKNRHFNTEYKFQSKK